MVVRKDGSLEKPVRHAADTRKQPLGIYAQAVKGSATPSEDTDKAETGILRDGANRIPLNELGGDAARQPDVPGLVPVDATEDRVGGRLLRQDTIGLEQRGKDQANGGIEGRDRGKVQPDVGLRDAEIKTEQGTAQLPVRRGCGQCAAQSPQQPFMNELLFCDACKCTASGVLEGRTSETGEGERRRFLAAGENLQQLGERLGLRIPEPERSGEWRGRNRVGEPKADLLVDRSGHGGLPPADVAAAVSVSSRVAELGDQRPILVAAHNVAGLVEGPQRLRKEAVIQIELVIDDRPFVRVDVRDLVQ